MSKRKPRGYWTLERCMEDAAQYSGRRKWKVANQTAYHAALKNGWLDRCCAHMNTPAKKPAGYWTLERLMEDAANYTQRSEWKKANSSAYSTALRNGWLDRCCAHMIATSKPDGHWTLERLMEDAALYPTRSDWKFGSYGAYQAALRKGFMDQCCAHMTSRHKPHGYWTLETCIEDAAKYSTRSEWDCKSRFAYKKAMYNGWLDQCCAHMERAGGTANDVVYIWRDAGSDLHKVGVTSDRVGEDRIAICRRHNGMDPRIVFMLKVDDARAVESQLLELGTDPELDSSVDGYTEFRKLTDADLGKAVSIAYEAALAA